ncbi:MAG TPA: TrkA family potassium uptake protein [Candidatus Flavonifractor intestinipullorum]|uniref:TrkA family potassium uptake protein n=1 Tax=Candidatus Flavonifractor intestinipullorum TaxID=2838587 RepID=A0A9D2MAY2_9FIRM|nr:TrkA family potassium uptake protein [Candidatus Flavonifractor intestinipullorum]
MKKKEISSFGVIGLGRFGTALVKTLSDAGKEVIAVDKEEAKVKSVRKYTDYAFVVGELNQETLEETGIQNCGSVTICIGEKMDVSILTTMLVLKMGIPQVIAKANSQEHGEVLKRLGATVVYPEADMAVRIGKRLISGNLIDYISLDDDVEVRRIQVSGKIVGHTIQEINVRRTYGINIIAIERGHRTNVEFSPQYEFQEGDIVAVIGKIDKIDRFEEDIKS